MLPALPPRHLEEQCRTSPVSWHLPSVGSWSCLGLETAEGRSRGFSPAQGQCQPSCGSAATERHCGHLVLLVVWLMLHKAGAASLWCSKGSPWPWAAGPPGCCCGSFPGHTVHGLPLEVSTMGHHGSGKGRSELWEQWGSYRGEDGNNDRNLDNNFICSLMCTHGCC